MRNNHQATGFLFQMETALWLILLGAAAMVYWPALEYMVDMWRIPLYGGADYSHGPLLPFVSIAALWIHRKAFADASKKTSAWGVALVVVALLLHWIGVRSGFLRLSLVSLLMLLWGSGLALYGGSVARLLLFPVGYLAFCIPLNILDGLSFRLRIMAAILSNGILSGLGVASRRVGTAIHYTAGGSFAFDVADPCSGIRSLLALTALAAAYAYFTQKTARGKWLLFLCAIPIAVVANVARIISVALVAQFWGQDAALHLYHDYSGYIVFGVATLLMMAAGHLIAMSRWGHKTKVIS